jgi:hypothetical protein
VKPFLTKQGFLDPEFASVVAAPARYYSDFFGLQAIHDLPKNRIVSDFVPARGEVMAEDSVSVTIRFKAGYTAQFFPLSSLDVMGSSAPISHVAFTGPDWRTLRQTLKSFLSLLDTLRLTDTYLVPNPGYADEVEVARQLSSGTAAAVIADSTLSGFARTSDGVLLIGERVHGRPDDLAIVRRALESAKIDWLGLEMLDVAIQSVLDAYNRSTTASPEHEQARAQLIAYFANAWNGRAGPKTTGEENPYFKLIDAAHARGVRVIALEAASVPYLLFRYGEVDFGGAVRSLWWARHTPQSGRGIVFGGSAHFNSAKPVNVQDFIAARQPNRPLFSIKSIDKRTAR